MNEQDYGICQTAHYSRSARRFTIGLLTTGNFTRFAPGHWLGVIDAAQAQDVNVVCFLGIGVVAGEIPQPRVIPDGAHVLAPGSEVQVGVACDCCEGLRRVVGIPRGQELGVAGFPRLPVQVGLDLIQILDGSRNAGMGVGLRYGLAEGK